MHLKLIICHWTCAWGISLPVLGRKMSGEWGWFIRSLLVHITDLWIFLYGSDSERSSWVEVLYSSIRNRIAQLLVWYISVKITFRQIFPWIEKNVTASTMGRSVRAETGTESGWMVLWVSAVAWAGLGGLLAYIIRIYSGSFSPYCFGEGRKEELTSF